MQIYANNVATTTATALLSAVDTLLGVLAGTGARFPSIPVLNGDYFYATLQADNGDIEIVKCTMRVGDDLTLVRGQDGTTAKSFAAGTNIEMRFVAQQLRELDPSVYRGVPDGFAPLDGDALIPMSYLSPSLLTAAEGDAMYVTQSSINTASGVCGLNASGLIDEARLPTTVVLHDTAETDYVRKDTINENNGVAGLDSSGKIATSVLPASLTGTFVKTDGSTPITGAQVFQSTITATGKITASGGLSAQATDVTTLAVSGYITVGNGGKRGKVTYSTVAPTGVPADGDEWVQYT